MTFDERIQEIALALIRKSSMRHDSWRVTSLGTVPPGLPQLNEGELPLVSASFPDGEWYIWSTRRLHSFCGGTLQEVLATDVAGASWGEFKGQLGLANDATAPLQSLIATIQTHSGSSIQLRYEAGYASMAPIQGHKYWILKHPILHKLLTPSERWAYRAQRPRA